MSDAHYDVPMLQGERIWLRPIEERDLEAYRRACTDRDTASLAGFPYPMSETNLRRWFEQISVQHGSDAFYFTISTFQNAIDTVRNTLVKLEAIKGVLEQESGGN